MTRPACWDECATTVRDTWAELGAEVTVSTARPIVPGRYPSPELTCPHGVKYWCEPTGEQIARWVRDKVE